MIASYMVKLLNISRGYIDELKHQSLQAKRTFAFRN